MAKVVYSNGIDYISGALNKVKSNGQHSHEKMLLATHRTAATTSNSCNRIYLRKKVQRSTPVTQDEISARVRFTAVSQAVNTRQKDLSKITQDQMAFIAQRDTPGGKRTMKSYLWAVCGAEYDAAH